MYKLYKSIKETLNKIQVLLLSSFYELMTLEFDLISTHILLHLCPETPMEKYLHLHHINTEKEKVIFTSPVITERNVYLNPRIRTHFGI